MRRKEFLASLGVLAGAAFIPEVKSSSLKITATGFAGIGYPHPYERMRITTSGNVCMGITNPSQILKVTKRVNGGMQSLEYRIK